jgi:hypothetical protein
MNKLRTVCDEIAAVVSGSTDVVYTPNNPPSTMSLEQLPAAIVYPRTGQSSLFDHTPTILESATVWIDLCVKAEKRPLDEIVAESIDLQEPLSLALWRAWLTTKFNDSVYRLGTSGGGDPIRWSLVELTWGGHKTIGFRYEIDVAVTERL